MSNNRDNNRYPRGRNRSPEINGMVEMHNTRDGDSELLVKRFNRMVRNIGLLDEMRERRHFVKPSERRREAKRQRQRVIDKVNRRNNALFTSTGLPKVRKA
jgi:ribosomal protein S21